MSHGDRPYRELDSSFYRCWLALHYHLAHPLAELRLVLRATNRAPALSLTLFFGLLSFLLFFLDPATASFAALDRLETWLRILSLLAALTLAYLLGGLIALRLLPAGQYAQTVVAGNSEKVILRTISYKARRLAIAFILKTRTTDELFARLLPLTRRNCEAENVADARATADRLRDVEQRHGRTWRRQRLALTRKRIHALLLKKDREIRRLEAMKRVAADELGISSRRLCDQLIQFSPSMFKEGVGKYVQNLKEMLSMLPRMQSEPEIARFCGLVNQNRWFENAARSRAARLTELIGFGHLYGFLHAFVSSPSASGAVQVYARALIENEKAGWQLRGSRYRRRRRWETLCFLYRKQRAHPGFDLHQLIVRLCEEVERDLAGDARTQRDRVEVERTRRLLEAVTDAVDRPEAGGPPPHIDRQLEALNRLPAHVSRVIAEARARISERFLDLLAHTMVGLEGDLYIVTRGYSKTIREAVRGVLTSPQRRRILLFLLSGETPQDEFDTRRMKLEIGQLEKIREIRLAAGHPDLLVELLTRRDHVILVQGTECYDPDGRLVHRRSATTQVTQLIARLREKEVNTTSVALAECYKRQPEPLSQTRFFTDHFDRIALYRADRIISDCQD